MSSPWQAVLVSAGVAAGVSLSIDAVAKPWLELRKDRIVRRGRDKDEFVSDLFAYFAHLEQVRVLANNDVLGGLSVTVKDAYQQTIATMERAKRATWLPKPVLRLVLGALAGAQAKFHSMAIALDHPTRAKPPAVFPELTQKIRHEVSQEIAMDILEKLDVLASFEIPLKYVGTPGWRLIRRLILRRRAVVQIGQLELKWKLAEQGERSVSKADVQQQSTATDDPKNDATEPLQSA